MPSGKAPASSSSEVQEGSSPSSSALSEELITACKQHHKTNLEEKYKKFKEILSTHVISTPLNEIYTELYITEGGSGEVNNEHEVRQIEMMSRRQTAQERPIKCNDIFRPLAGQDEPIRTVLTRGVAGIGKTVSVQKFILDWAEGKANQDIHFIFPFPFRELNSNKDKKLSLVQLLHLFFPKTLEFPLLHSDAYKVMLIFDGLDECRLPLDFQDNEIVSDVTESTSVDVLLTNLIKGKLLPSALLWITTRPVAANQIPPDYVERVTDLRGFSDPQKEEYFRKRIKDKSLAEKVITHIKSSRSLYIMCHIPVFCWVSATVLKKVLNGSEKIPKTLTQMFTRFLIFQIKHKAQKKREKRDNDLQQTRERILALGKLAFQQLERGNLIFFENDLRECGIDVSKLVYSGVCTQIFREESALHTGKTFTFVHLSVQEFLAALFALLSFISDNRNVLQDQGTGHFGSFRRSRISDFLNCAVDKALKSENGHLDLFLRFLLGLSLQANQTLIQDLLPPTACDFHSNEETVRYIKEKIRENPSPEKFINLFHCLNELNDHSLVQEVQMYLNRSGDHRLSGARLSSAQWSALVFVLLNSEEELVEFDLSKYDKSDECLLRLQPVIKASRKAVMNCCSFTEEGCAVLAKALKSNPSHLRILELNCNYPGVSGVEEVSYLLEDPHCNLKKLAMADCRITDDGCMALIKALKLNPSHLRELNLSDNVLRDKGVKEISDLLKDRQCKLEKLQLCNCNITEKGCTHLAPALCLNFLNLTELNLSYNELKDSGVKLLFAALENPHSKLEKLGLDFCSITEKGCATLAKALKSNPLSHLRDLHLNYNNPGDSGVIQLSDLLRDPYCKLQKLLISGCNLTEKSCAALASALSSNFSKLKELDLSNNKLQDLGVTLLSVGLRNPQCKLEILRLDNCGITEAGCATLANALKLNPSHLRELDLNQNEVEESGVMLLSDLLKDSHHDQKYLQDESQATRSKNLKQDFSKPGANGENDDLLVNPNYKLLKQQFIDPSNPKELNLNFKNVGDSGVKLLSGYLMDPHCKVEKLLLRWSNLTENSCSVLASVLSSSFSQIRELNLSKNKLQDSGVSLLSAGLQNLYCKLEILSMCGCDLTKKSCVVLASVLSSSTSSLKELNLSGNKLHNSGVKQLCVGLENSYCNLEILRMKYCCITEDGYVALFQALKSSPSSQLRELNLSLNNPGESGMQLLSVLVESPHYKLELLE
ncbi:hypothetical protein NFI96_001534 [Prochilodus magdalenae]|nr:hypothetical protein NFI96_001534 [Prochilodus magdalenae]